jgi:hypothetical protein
MLTLANQPNSLDHNLHGYGYGEVYGMIPLCQHKPTSIAIQFYIMVLKVCRSNCKTDLAKGTYYNMKNQCGPMISDYHLNIKIWNRKSVITVTIKISTRKSAIDTMTFLS